MDQWHATEGVLILSERAYVQLVELRRPVRRYLQEPRSDPFKDIVGPFFSSRAARTVRWLRTQCIARHAATSEDHMSGTTQQLLPLAGVIIGALTSYLAGTVTERARWRREQSSRWDDKRAQAYADYGYLVKNVYVQCRRIIDLRNHTGKGSAQKLEEALAGLGRLTDERTAKWESVLLLGNPATIAAARTWHRRVWHIELLARGERADAEEWDRLHEQMIEDRTRFYTAARRDLGIRSGDVPPGGPWEALAHRPQTADA